MTCQHRTKILRLEIPPIAFIVVEHINDRALKNYDLSFILYGSVQIKRKYRVHIGQMKEQLKPLIQKCRTRGMNNA